MHTALEEDKPVDPDERPTPDTDTPEEIEESEELLDAPDDHFELLGWTVTRELGGKKS